jgi:hypothetical protein
MVFYCSLSSKSFFLLCGVAISINLLGSLERDIFLITCLLEDILPRSWGVLSGQRQIFGAFIKTKKLVEIFWTLAELSSRSDQRRVRDPERLPSLTVYYLVTK